MEDPSRCLLEEFVHARMGPRFKYRLLKGVSVKMALKMMREHDGLLCDLFRAYDKINKSVALLEDARRTLEEMQNFEHAPLYESHAMTQLGLLHEQLSDGGAFNDCVHISTLYSTLVITMERYCESCEALGYLSQLRGVKCEGRKAPQMGRDFGSREIYKGKKRRV